MKIRKVDDKPMVIHTKEKAKIHAHEPKGAKIKGSNIYTVEKGPKTIGAKVSDDKKKSYRNFDLFRGDKNITEYMREHCNQFYCDICDAVKGDNSFLGEDFVNLLKDELGELQDICLIIPEILELNDRGLIKATYEKGFQLFERMKPYFYTRYSWRENGGFYYRIRQGDFRIKAGEDSKEKKMQLFHIKTTLRNRVGAYRYSVAGSPCLYLASDRELAWFECGMPKQFSYCQMLIDEDNDNGLVLVDFSFRPVDVLSSITCWLLNARRQDKKDVDVYYKFLLRYIMIYPIAAACSVKVKDRNTKFVEEYVFPQLFMQWIRETDEFDGVRYKSSLNTNLVDGMGAINIALPVKEYRADGLDRRLAEKITVSDIGYLDVNSDFQKYNDILEKIKDYINGIQMFMNQVPFYGDYMIELTDVCKCVIKTYNALMEGNYQNSELIFSYLDLLYAHASLLYANRDFKIQECINKTEARHRQAIDEEKLKEQFEEFHQLMNQILHKKNLSMQQTDQIKKQQKRIPQITTRLEQIDKVLNKLYEDNALGTIPQDRYEQMSQKYSEEYYSLKAELEQLREQLSAYENAGGRAQKFLKLTERHAAFTELTPAILNEFISRIEVHERDQKRARYAIQHISIYFNYIGKFENEVTQLAEPTEQEIRQMREEIEEAKKEKSRAYHRQYSREYRARKLEKQREYDRMKAREYRAKKKAQAAAAQPTQ